MIFLRYFFFHPSLVTDIRRYRQERIKIFEILLLTIQKTLFRVLYTSYTIKQQKQMLCFPSKTSMDYRNFDWSN